MVRSDQSVALDTGRNIQWVGELSLRLAKLLVDDYKAHSERRNGLSKNSLCRRWGATLGVAQNDPIPLAFALRGPQDALFKHLQIFSTRLKTAASSSPRPSAAGYLP
jgi:hypothetical protein